MVKETEKRYKCNVTGEPIDPSVDCADCHTRSCMVNVGFLAEPELLDEYKEKDSDEESKK